MTISDLKRSIDRCKTDQKYWFTRINALLNEIAKSRDRCKVYEAEIASKQAKNKARYEATKAAK